MKQLYIGLLLLLFLLGQSRVGFAQLKQVTFEELEQLQKIEQRKVIVFVHTDWCHYCQQMWHSTFKNKELVALLNEKFYFVELNAEAERNITFNNQVFRFKPNGNNTGMHELAITLAQINNKVAFPSIVIINNVYETVFQSNQAIRTKDFITLLSSLK